MTRSPSAAGDHERRRRRDPARQPASRSTSTRSSSSPPATAPGGGYSPVLGPVVACARCGCLLLDSAAARAAHDRHHASLRQLWQRGNGSG